MAGQTRGARRPLIALIALVVILIVGYAVRAAEGGSSGSPSTPSSSTPGGSTNPGEVALSSLPAQATQTYRLIRSDGPFPYPHDDGVVFHNFEHELPSEADGYYHEYTVPTPGSDSRGVRRLVLARDGTLYYTGDHYGTFQRVDVSR